METLHETRPSVYRGVPMADYHAWDCASSSRLSKLIRSPAHLRAYIDLPQQDTAALAFGRAAHTAILEPDELDARYVTVGGRCKATTQKGAQCSKSATVPFKNGDAVCTIHAKEWSDDRDTRELLSTEDRNRVIGMRESVRSIERANAMLESLGDVELSLVWEDEETGVLCKARWDGYSPIGGGCIIDLKTTADASRRAFERSIFQYGYHRQGALYLAAGKAHGIEAAHYVIIAVEKEPPYGACLYRLTEDAIMAGEEQNRALLARYAECVETGEYPGYSTEVQDVGLPPWAWDILQEQVS